MKTTIFVPTITSDASWIFCNQEHAFDQGLLNGEGKILRGYHNREDAIAAYLEKQPQEPFAVMHLIIDHDTQTTLGFGGALVGNDTDASGRRIWNLSRDGSNFLFAQGKFQLLMEIIPVQHTGICLY